MLIPRIHLSLSCSFLVAFLCSLSSGVSDWDPLGYDLRHEVLVLAFSQDQPLILPMTSFPYGYSTAQYIRIVHIISVVQIMENVPPCQCQVSESECNSLLMIRSVEDQATRTDPIRGQSSRQHRYIFWSQKSFNLVCALFICLSSLMYFSRCQTQKTVPSPIISWKL